MSSLEVLRLKTNIEMLTVGGDLSLYNLVLALAMHSLNLMS